MIIGVKGARSAKTESQAESYALKHDPTRSKTPLALGIALAGALAYIKSMITPVQAAAGQAPEAEPVTKAVAPTPDGAVAIAPTLPETPPAAALSPAPHPQEASNVGSTAGARPGILPQAPPGLGGTAPFIAQPQVGTPPSGPSDFQPSAGAGPAPSGPSHAGAGTAGDAEPPSSAAEEGGEPGQKPDGAGGTGPTDGGSGEPTRTNRAPRLAGPVLLPDVALGAVLLVRLEDLLRGASDPDGDTLRVQDLSVAGGTLEPSAAGWLFRPAGVLGPVTISYRISDGTVAVPQLATFDVVRSRLEGSSGSDLLVGTPEGDDIDGREGDDAIDAREGDDVVFGGAGDDHIAAGPGDDLVFAGAGDDIVFGGAGNDRIFGGAGRDRLYGGDGDDILHGEDGADDLYGGAGDDVLFGGAGADTLSGGRGSDSVFGGDGDDRVVADADAAPDVLDGGAGHDTIDFSLMAAPLTVDLEKGRASSIEIGEDRLSSFEVVIGGSGNDTLRGGGGDDTLIGGAGDDTIEGGGGNDVLVDGTGSDSVFGGAGDDRVIAAPDARSDSFDGGAGTDVIDYSAATAPIMVDLATGRASGIEIGEDSLTGFEAAIGGAGNDSFVAGAQPTIFTGGGGENLFEYKVQSDPQGEVTHAILDFKIGDTIRMSKWDIFERAVDALEDRFKKVYGGDGNDDLPIRYRHDESEEGIRTKIEADLDLDDDFETTVSIAGHHYLDFVETI